MLPSLLTPPVVAVGVALAAASGEVATGVLPGAAAAAFSLTSYELWRRREQPWHDPAVIVLLLPALAGGVWVAVGGLVTGVERDDDARLLLEVGPGVALTGLVTTLISYHGRHRP
jgi:hypothetical protein